MQTFLGFCQDLPKARFEPGDVLLKEGEKTGKLFFVIDGQFEILKGDFQVDIVSDPGAIFGEISVLLDMPHMATVRALTASTAYVADAGSEFLQANSELNYHLSKLLAQRLNSVTSYLVDLKRQFDDRQDHLGMVDEVLESLVHQQLDEFAPGSDRDPDLKM